MHQKIFVLDTSVFIYDPHCYNNFNDNTVIIPITILDELDKLKKSPNEAGKNARVAIRNLDRLSIMGEIHNGINIENNIHLKIDASAYGAIGPDPSYGDSKILACALKAKEKSSQVILVSRDINLRTRARALGLLAEDYEKDNVSTEELFKGFRMIKNQEAGIDLFSKGMISLASSDLNLYPNECVLFQGDDGKGISAGRCIGNDIVLIKDKTPWGLALRNKEQLFAADMLLDPSIPLITIIGKAGSGKTLSSVASGLEMVVNRKIYHNFIIYRPIQPVGNDIGYLPGDISEKLNPWFTSIDDAFAFLFSDNSRKKDGWKNQLFQYMDSGIIQKEAITYIRGRSIPNSFMLIDEAQNLSKEEVKTILTRAGNNTKIVLTGDIEQIDSKYLDSENNGLTYAIDKFKDSPLAGHITFEKGERSELATIASEIL